MLKWFCKLAVYKTAPYSSLLIRSKIFKIEAALTSGFFIVCQQLFEVQIGLAKRKIKVYKYAEIF